MNLPKRKPTRLKEYDYSAPGAYFITICTHNKECLLSNIVGAIRESPLQHRSVIDKMVGFLKMNVSKRIHNKMWQRSYHDHIIRSEEDYRRIWEYIDTNVVRWKNDCFYIWGGLNVSKNRG